MTPCLHPEDQSCMPHSQVRFFRWAAMELVTPGGARSSRSIHVKSACARRLSGTHLPLVRSEGMLFEIRAPSERRNSILPGTSCRLTRPG